MKELDLLLLGYLETRYPTAGESRQLAFQALLEQEDPIIWRWLVGADPLPEGALGEVLGVLRQMR